MLKLHFSAVRFSGLSLHFHSITDYLLGLFLCARVSDDWRCPSTDRLLYMAHALRLLLQPCAKIFRKLHTACYML